jgi:hypothetical protein
MSESLHLNLIKEEEMRSPNPVRLRVLLPTLALGAALACLTGWALLALRAHAQTTVRDTVKLSIQELSSAHSQVLALRSQEKEISAIIRQLRFYERSRIRFGDALCKIPDHVPPNIQLTEMRVPPPPPALVDPKQPSLGPTNTWERVSLRLIGRTAGDSASAAVNTLLAALRTPAYSNLVETAEIPKGAFRQDTTSRNVATRDTLLFEITCGCQPRRFE